RFFHQKTNAPTRLFFFQAEDGIRDLTVTGVQTCALPICHGSTLHSVMKCGVWCQMSGKISLTPDTRHQAPSDCVHHAQRDLRGRSEERRVGKESRSRKSLANTPVKFPYFTVTLPCT